MTKLLHFHILSHSWTWKILALKGLRFCWYQEPRETTLSFIILFSPDTSAGGNSQRLKRGDISMDPCFRKGDKKRSGRFNTNNIMSRFPFLRRCEASEALKLSSETVGCVAPGLLHPATRRVRNDGVEKYDDICMNRPEESISG